MSSTSQIARDLEALIGTAAFAGADRFIDYVATYLNQAAENEVVSPMDFGAVGDGSADDTTALLAALNSGSMVDGGGRTYAVDGELAPTTFGGLRNIKILQTDTTAQHTLYLFNLANVFLENVEINANGQTGTGSQSTSHALYVYDCSRCRLENVTVRNAGAISGITLQTIGSAHVSRVRVFDSAATFASQPSDDEFHGIYLVGVSRFVLSDCTVDTQTPDWPSRPATYRRWGRGFVFASCSDGVITGCVARNVDQGFDATGSALNQNLTFVGCVAVDCTTVGFKQANYWRAMHYSGCMAVRCGLFGFQQAGPSESGQTCVDSLSVGCMAVDIGSNGLWKGDGSGQFLGTPNGFRVMAGGFDASYPRAVHWANCIATDRQSVKTMAIGFSSDVNAGVRSLGNDINTLSGCQSFGHTSSPFSNIGGHTATVQRTTSQSIPTGVWTTITWSSAVSDNARLWDEANAIQPRMDGSYLALASGTFASNSTGVRGIRVTINGNARPETVIAAISGADTSLQAQVQERMNRDGFMRVQVYQDSGGALNFTAGRFSVTRLADSS